MGLVFLLSGTNTIAEVAAMGRLMAIFALLDKGIELVLVPLLARISHKGHFVRRVLQSVVMVGALLALPFLSSILLPELWIWLLGAAYRNVAPVLKWMVLMACVDRLNGCIMWGLVAQGVVRRQWLSSVIGISAQAVSITLFGIATTKAAVFLMFSRSLATITVQSVLLWAVYRRAARQTHQS